MVTKSFKKELDGLSPYQLTMAVKQWMKTHDARLQLTFNWKHKSFEDIPEEFNIEDLLVLKSIEEEEEQPRKKTRYIKL
jgi:hypothetical protein